MKTDELRDIYLSFFESKGHARRPSDVLVPTWDPSVLFTPAGMNQFKDHFLGRVKLDFTRATTCQKCLRTGDIDNVGRTAYHHTFFEMLGNFSFGDYFKRDAIHWAWEFLTEKKWLGIDPDRLSVTVYKDDDEAAGIWEKGVGLPATRIERLDEDENFWPASAPSEGPDGVCGPCSEIYYHPPGGQAVEIWNLVFTQFNRVGDPPDNLRPLPSKNIDTGMGLERAASVLQGVTTNYHIDTLRPIVEAAGEVCGIKYEPNSDTGRRLRRITDHIRACSLAVHENVYPGANKEKYVIRRLLRRAVLDGHQMGLREAFLYQLVPAVVEMMKRPYPELTETAERVAKVIRAEEENFFGTIDAGLARMERIFGELEQQNRVVVDGAEAADLYQTYGVPAELFETMAAERNLTFDWDGYRRAMERHGEDSGKPQHTVMGDTGPVGALKKALHETTFLGYDRTESAAEVKGIIAQHQLCDQVSEVGHEEEIVVVLDQTPFYAESGGQVGDTGELRADGMKFQVVDVQKDGALFLHCGHLLEGTLHAGQGVTAEVDVERRQGIRRAHSATHLLHHALQSALGSHAQQQGSKVDEDWLRFDFTNLSAVDAEQLAKIEVDVVKRVQDSAPVNWQVLPLAEARAAGAMMLFGEKYPDPVRMVSMGDFSRELCGGTHLDNTSEVLAFDILSEEGVSAGTRRITALTGRKAIDHLRQTRDTLTAAANALAVAEHQAPEAVKSLAGQVRDLKKQLATGNQPGPAPKPPAATSAAGALSDAEAKQLLREAARALAVAPFEVVTRVKALLADLKELQRQVKHQAEAGTLTPESLVEHAVEVGGVKVIVCETEGTNPNVMRQLIDEVRRNHSPCAVLLASGGEGKVTLVAGLSRDLVERGLSSGNWVRDTAKIVGGSGGGKPDMAQAGGKEPEKIPAALEQALASIREQLAG